VVDVPDDEKSLLDEAEGLGAGYEERQVRVIDFEGGEHDVQAYVASLSAMDDGLRPYSWYLGLIVRGARARGLPEEYVQWLEQWESVQDTDPIRLAKADRLCE
jgi:hypothetical protein